MKIALAFVTSIFLLAPAAAQDLPVLDQIEMFSQARDSGHSGIARKSKPVDARPAVPGEVVVSVITGEGVETTSPPAQEGDWVVRNRCNADKADDTLILVTAAKFPSRYGAAQSEPDSEGYSTFIPSGAEMGYFIVPETTGEFQFTAPWGEPMVARPGDAIVQIPDDPDDTYRIARSEFDCTYEILKPAQ